MIFEASLAPFHLALLALSAHASPDHPSFVSKEEGNYLGLFVYFLSWYQEPEGPSRVGWGLAGKDGGGGSGPGSNPQRLAFTRDLGPYLSQKPPFTNEETNQKRGNNLLQIAQ